MILGMSLATFVLVHVVISLIGIVAGIIVMFGMLGSKRMPGLTAIFLLFTILTSATGFLIPPLLSEKLLPSHMIGILSLVLLAIACIALYGMKLAGAWRWIYALTALVSLYLNVFVLVIQSLPEGAGAACAGAERAAGRAAVRHRPGHRAGVLRHRDHRRDPAIPAGADIHLTGSVFRREPESSISHIRIPGPRGDACSGMTA